MKVYEILLLIYIISYWITYILILGINEEIISICIKLGSMILCILLIIIIFSCGIIYDAWDKIDTYLKADLRIVDVSFDMPMCALRIIEMVVN